MMIEKAVVVGVFDGVHAGHRHLLHQLKDIAHSRGLKPIAVTFSRHPLELVSPERVPLQICSADERERLLHAEGVEPLWLDFTPELRAMTAMQFLQFLRDRGISLLLMGFNNRIGSDRRCGAELAGGSVEVLTAEELPDADVSSSEVRNAVERGDMGCAARMLGRRFALIGEVVAGRRVGRTIGFPTANISVCSGMLMPPNGVYEAAVDDRKAVVNIGCRPTLDNGNDTTVEVHLLDFDGNIYGKTLRVEFVRRLRREMKFGSLDELKAQISRDIESVRNGK